MTKRGVDGHSVVLIDVRGHLSYACRCSGAARMRRSEEVCVSEDSINYRIGSKEDLLCAKIHQRMDSIEDLLARLRSSRSGLLAELCALTGERLDGAVKVMDGQDRFLRRRITSGQKDGVICPDVDPALIASTIRGIVRCLSRQAGKGAAHESGRRGRPDRCATAVS